MTVAFVQGVTQAQCADQHLSTVDAVPSDAYEQAVTEALEKVAVWAGGAPSMSLMRATFEAVATLGATVCLSGTRVYFVDRDGAKWSVARVNALARVINVKYGRCAACGERIPLDAYRRRQRGARSDRRYCSNACRQRAYRQRKENP